MQFIFFKNYFLAYLQKAFKLQKYKNEINFIIYIHFIMFLFNDYVVLHSIYYDFSGDKDIQVQKLSFSSTFRFILY